MKTEHAPEDLRNLLQAGILIVDALLARQRDLADQAEQWIREVAAVGGTVDIEPVTRVVDEEHGQPLEAPFVLLGTVYRVSLDVDGRSVGLEVMVHDEWQHLAEGFWDGLNVELEGDDAGDVLAPSCTMALREALAMWQAGGWLDLPTGGRVRFEDGRPVQVDDGGTATREELLADLARLGWTVELGEWSRASASTPNLLAPVVASTQADDAEGGDEPADA